MAHALSTGVARLEALTSWQHIEHPPLGLWQIYFRHELGAYYASTPRGLFGKRSKLGHPADHLIGGIATLMLGLVWLLGSKLKGM